MSHRDGEPSLPFYRPRERLGIHKRKRKEGKEEKRKTGGEEGSGVMFLFSPAGGPHYAYSDSSHVPAIGRCLHPVMTFRPVAARGVVNISP
jgi:hypothetical protein